MKLFAFGEMKGNIAEAVRHLQQQAHLVADRAVSADLRFLHRLLDGVPLAITVIFGDSHMLDAATNTWDHVKNPNAPSALNTPGSGPSSAR
jgi:NNP family nitrate/nitrite transporter-like MFS transporter